MSNTQSKKNIPSFLFKAHAIIAVLFIINALASIYFEHHILNHATPDTNSDATFTLMSIALPALIIAVLSLLKKRAAFIVGLILNVITVPDLINFHYLLMISKISVRIHLVPGVMYTTWAHDILTLLFLIVNVVCILAWITCAIKNKRPPSV